ncbi:MAG: RES family NAD+ phosphorylase [Desulfobaccales bacterium]|nr:RES family NAD+ phosphorylase [Desulfobaccales bacterium]
MPLEELGPLFRNIARIYDPVEGPDSLGRGDSIALLLQEDWDIFSDRIENADLMDEMAISILEAGLHPKNDIDEPDYQGNFRHPRDWLEDNWHEKIERIMTESQPAIVDEKGEPSQSSLNSAFDQEAHEVAFEDFGIVLEEGEILYRARIHKDRTRVEPFDLHELGAPPPEKAEAGRANRLGEAVLYLASDEHTAISEVRAWKGAPVAIARIRLERRLWIVNLKHHKPTKSPFFEELLDWKVQLAGLFRRFGEELSRPIMKNEEEILYKPSQHLCDLIRQNGFDGVAYPSAMGKGFNVVIFDPKVVKIMDHKYVRVKNVQYDYDNLRNHEPIYNETPYDHLLSTKK